MIGNLCPHCDTPRFSSTIELLAWAKKVGHQEMVLAARAAGLEEAAIAAMLNELAKARAMK